MRRVRRRATHRRHPSRLRSMTGGGKAETAKSVSFLQMVKRSRADLDDIEMHRCLLRLELAKLDVDRLELTLEDGRLQLEVQVEHRLRLARQRLRLVGLRRLVLAQTLEVAQWVRMSWQNERSVKKRTNLCSVMTTSRNWPMVPS